MTGMAGNRRSRYIGGLHNRARPKRVNGEAGWLAICGSCTNIYSFSVIRMVMAICLEKYIVKSSEFPPPYRGSLGRTVMDSKLFWINRMSFFLLPSSSWNPPMLFLHQTANARGGQSVQWSVLGLVSFTELSTWPWLLVGFGEFAGVAGMTLWRQLQTCPCWRQLYYSRRRPSRQWDEREQGPLAPSLPLSWLPRKPCFWTLGPGLQNSDGNTGWGHWPSEGVDHICQSSGRRNSGRWQSGYLGFPSSFTAHELSVLRHNPFISDSLFSLYGIRIKIQENCWDLARESKGQSAVLWLGECGSF